MWRGEEWEVVGGNGRWGMGDSTVRRGEVDEKVVRRAMRRLCGWVSEWSF